MGLRRFVPRAAVARLPVVAWAQEAPQPPPKFGARAELVVVDVAVTDPKGKPVIGLEREDFRVLENGKAQDIATIEAVEIADATASSAPAGGSGASTAPSDPPTMAIVFDDLHLRPFDAERLKMAVRDLLRAESGAGTRVALIAPGAGIARMGQLPEAERDFDNVLRLLKGVAEPFRPEMSEQEAYEIHGLRNEQIEMLVAERWMLKGLGGIDMVSTRAEVRAKAAERNGEWSVHRQSTGSLDGYRQAIGASRRANVPIHLLDARGLDGLSAPQDLDMQQASTVRPSGPSFSAQATQDRQAAAEGAEHVALDTGGLGPPQPRRPGRRAGGHRGHLAQLRRARVLPEGWPP